MCHGMRSFLDDFRRAFDRETGPFLHRCSVYVLLCMLSLSHQPLVPSQSFLDLDKSLVLA